MLDELDGMTLDELAGICFCNTEWIVELVMDLMEQVDELQGQPRVLGL